MNFEKIEKKQEGRFITRYDISYRLENGKEKVYEMISRDKNIESYGDLVKRPVDAVVLIIHNEAGDKILLNKEFRMAVGEAVYNFPAGLIDPGEDVLQAARRELMEETGLELISVDDIIGESYSAVGFSNEKNMCIVGNARGSFKPSTSFEEEIEAGWYSREQVSQLLQSCRFAARTQAYCYLWSRNHQ